MSNLQNNPGGGNPASVDEMSREVDQIQKRLVELRQLQARGRSQFIAISILIVLMFAVFMGATYWRIRDNFNPEAVQKAVNDRGPAVLPLARDLLVHAGKNAMPAYREALVQGMRQHGPDLASETLARFQQVPEHNGKVMQDKLQVTFANAIKKVDPDFKAAFPSLSDEQRQHLVQDFLMSQIEEQNKRVASRCNQLLSNDLARLNETLDKFQIEDANQPKDAEALEHQFLRTMVAILDDQVDRAYAAPSAEDAKGSLKPTSRPSPEALAQ